LITHRNAASPTSPKICADSEIVETIWQPMEVQVGRMKERLPDGFEKSPLSRIHVLTIVEISSRLFAAE
jgi:hypothetical protein